ncbi:MAG: DUF1858 domain-containing protein [Oscillospiraceae bacterium]|nr:DUF1858 domain-containing protein [Oscillospiraceae bacterium]
MAQITKDMVIADLLETDIAEDALPILQELGMHCLGCVHANKETLAEACEAHDVDVDLIVEKLTALLNR